MWKKLLWAASIGQVLCMAALGATASAQTIPQSIGLITASVLLYTVSAKVELSKSPQTHKKVVLGLAILYRLILLPFAPGMSEDVHRYWWEGKTQAEGRNPYLEAPEEEGIPGKGFRSGYGPAMMLVERVTYTVAIQVAPDRAGQAFWMKLPAVLFEAATLALLSGLPVRQLVWYAWSPLPVVEFWWNGHNDAIPVFFVAAMVLLVQRKRWGWAMLAVGMGIAAKWWPAVLLPWLIWRAWRWAPVAALPTLVAALPFVTAPWSTLADNARFMSGFVGGWRNNDSIYGLLLWWRGDQYEAKYLAFALIAAAVLWMVRWPVERAAVGSIVAMLLVSANCHPWYLTWFTPLLVWIPWWPLLVWQALMPLAYVVLIGWHARGEWDGATAIRWWIWVPVYGAMVVSWLRLRRARQSR